MYNVYKVPQLKPRNRRPGRTRERQSVANTLYIMLSAVSAEQDSLNNNFFKNTKIIPVIVNNAVQKTNKKRERGNLLI